jgi:prepilin-type N-terminal cleavage/methylation domain-containing protein/prepilin-type processing-associated H-X9-DG protein
VASKSQHGLTLVELLVVIAIIGVLVAMTFPAMSAAVGVAHQTACASNLRQIGFATQMYLKDNNGWFFWLVTDKPGVGRIWYFGMESLDSLGKPEGDRTLDRTRGKLYPYLHSAESVEMCPAVPFGGAYKPKFEGGAWTYGVNRYMSSHQMPSAKKTNGTGNGNLSWIRTREAGRTLLFADSAQVNTFQAPASPKNPMVEDWYYIEPKRAYVQFRHSGRANVLFADWHIELAGPAPGSFDRRMPSALIGYFDPAEVLLEPLGKK